MEFRDTIAAVSTPPGAGGIGLVRLSGVRALPIARAIFTPRRAADPLPPRRLILGNIRDPATGALLDEVLFSYLPPPRTYTREPMVEINAHSGPLVLKKILELLIAGGARLAEPGEFTLRAFLNGRIDLTRAEAVIELIQAQSDQALLQANRLLRGELQERSAALRDALVALLAQLEAAIDFPEEELDDLSPEGWIGELERTVLSPLDQLIRAHEEGRIYREGVSLVIVGKPNVGKSSLLNRLLREERALVTPVPGTTRDTIEETLHLRGFPFRIIDTAGIHRSPDAVEQAGIARARQKIETAHLILFMIDRSQPLEENDLDLYREIRGKPHWLILNKIDLPAALPDSEVDRCFPDIFRLSLSARTGQGVESLKHSAGDWFLRDHPPESAPALVPTLRQKSTLEAARKALGQARDEMERGVSAEFVALFVQQALNELGALIGLDRAANEDVLEQIFSRFCIGK